MATMKVGTEEVLKIMYGTEELTTLAIGGWSFPVGGDDDYASKPFTIEALGSGDFYIRSAQVDYSIDGGDTWNTTTGATTLNLNEGDTVQFRREAIEAKSVKSPLANMLSGNTSVTFNVYGNIMSLLYGDNFVGETTIIGGYWSFQSLFKGSSVIDASNLILPSTTLTDSCYQEMFQSCTGLTSAPKLPATTLASSCYRDMFNGCRTLTSAPELPATTLVSNCYNEMFMSCSNLTTAPELPATTLVSNCYRFIFNACSKLQYVKCLATNNDSGTYTSYWSWGWATTGTFVKAAGATWPTGASGIPDGWTVEEVD